MRGSKCVVMNSIYLTNNSWRFYKHIDADWYYVHVLFFTSFVSFAKNSCEVIVCEILNGGYYSILVVLMWKIVDDGSIGLGWLNCSICYTCDKLSVWMYVCLSLSLSSFLLILLVSYLSIFFANTSVVFILCKRRDCFYLF